MANYDIISSDTKKHYTVQENGINNETSLVLIGHGQPQYGEDQNTNFLHLLENFASVNEPRKPIVGQLWFKKNSNEDDDTTYDLCVCKQALEGNSVWDKIAVVSTSTDGPEKPITGDIWYDTHTHSLKIFDSNLNGWNVIGPDDAIHKEKINESTIMTKNSNNQISYRIPATVFAKNIENEGDDKSASGSLNLVTMKILAKEIFDTPSDVKTPRSAAWIYKFLVSAYEKTKDEYNYGVSIVGGANYELIGITENTDWIVDLYKSNGDFVVSVQDNGEKKLTDSRIVVGFDIDIVRV